MQPFLEIACAGWHNIHVKSRTGHSLAAYGPIACALLPDLSSDIAREVTKVHGIAGLTRPYVPRVTEPPLRAPHYTASQSAIAGDNGRPGEVNLAHGGVLVIDQPSGFGREATGAVAIAVRDGRTAIHRHDHVIRMPARFRLMVTTRNDELDVKRHDLDDRGEQATQMLNLCDIEITGGWPVDEAIPSERLLAGRERIARAMAILRDNPPRPRVTAEQGDRKHRRHDVARTIAALDGRPDVAARDLAEADDLLSR